jgi:PAS domain S-box-containing protein
VNVKIEPQNSDPEKNNERLIPALPIAAELQESILNGLGAGLFVCDTRSRHFSFVQISPRFTELTGYPSEKIIGEKLSVLYGTRTDAATVKAIERALGRGQSFRGELLCYCADGAAVVWCELVIVPRNGEPRTPEYFIGALVDISERKQREQQLRDQEVNCRRIFENSVQGIYQSTPGGRYLQVNQALAKMYGYRSPDALLKQVSDIENQIYVDPAMRERFKALINENDEVRGLEYQVRRRDGKIIWISENARVIRDTNGRARYYEGFIEEITQRKEAEAALQESQLQLMETSRQIGLAEMATGLLHNIGNALNSITVSTDVAADKVRSSRTDNLSKAIALLQKQAAEPGHFLADDAKGQQLIAYLDQLARYFAEEKTELLEELKCLKKAVEHANEIIACQQTCAKTSRRAETVKAVELVEDALRMNSNSLARHRIAVVRDYAPDLPPVTVQKHQILQILVNLIRNAQKACEDSGSPDKRLTLRMSSVPEIRQVQIEVQDSGIGIPRENLARLFTHGFTTRKDGHGFGLHSGARMAEVMGGSLTAHSDGIGQGARFILAFPVEPPLRPGEKKIRS